MTLNIRSVNLALIEICYEDKDNVSTITNQIMDVLESADVYFTGDGVIHLPHDEMRPGDWFYYGESDYCVSPYRMPDYDLCEKFGGA